MHKPVQKCYPSGHGAGLTIIGYALLIAGIVLLFVCIPHWALFALLGVVLIAIGLMLLKWSKAWR